MNRERQFYRRYWENTWRETIKALGSRRTSRIDGWFHYSFLSFLLPVFFISSTCVMWLTRPKILVTRIEMQWEGKDEFDHDSKYAIYQKFLESRATGKGIWWKKKYPCFSCTKVCFRKKQLWKSVDCRCTWDTAGIYRASG